MSSLRSRFHAQAGARSPACSDGFVAFYEVRSSGSAQVEYKVLSEKTGIDGVRKFDAHIEVYTKDKRIKVTYDT